MTDLTALLGLTYPLFQGGMSGISKSSLVAAVSQAGGLGILTSSGLSIQELAEGIRAVRQQTSKPFGVNLMLKQANVAEVIDLIIQEKVPVVTTGAGSPAPYLPRLKEAGIRVFPVVASVQHAKKMASLGVDGLIAEGMESGGHIGRVPTFSLLPQIVRAVDVPVLAAGGIYDHQSVLAAQALGASGVQAGTIFLASQECQLPQTYQEALLGANDQGTQVLGSLGKTPLRCLSNDYARQVLALEQSGLDQEQVRARLYQAYANALAGQATGDLCFLAGTVAGQIQAIEPVDAIIKRLFP